MDRNCNLYIPFWLYSNSSHVQMVLSMLLLYIPFWLYSNWCNRRTAWKISDLYIPFWLYSNARFGTEEILFIVFTFHSGYILILSSNSRLHNLLAFTFHSGYILIISDSFRWYSAGNFTFHSGYILILHLLLYSMDKDSLHSILVIF